jgi:hypothetical protein
VAVLVLGSGLMTDSYGTWKAFGTLVAAWLTLAIYSFLYRDNPVYKFAEHLFVGIAAGYGVAVTVYQTVLPNLVYKLVFPGPGTRGAELRDWSPDFWLLVPLAFGLLFFARFSQRYNYMLRWSLAFLIGGFAGVKLTGFAQGDLVAQAGATMLPVWGVDFFPEFPFLRTGAFGLNHLLIIAGVLTTLAYFFFSRPHQGVLGGISRVGVWFLMIAFGASFGYTVMARISLLIGRLMFLAQDWLGII